jgi:hypothetical protein
MVLQPFDVLLSSYLTPHAAASMYSHHLQLPLESVRKPEFWPDYHPSISEASSAVPKQGSDFPANPLLAVGGSRVVLGKPDDFPSFGFDNEYGRKEIQVGLRVQGVLQGSC